MRNLVGAQLRGWVSSFKETWGLIKSESFECDLFVGTRTNPHLSASGLQRGELVEFEVAPDPGAGSYQAVRVRQLNSMPPEPPAPPQARMPRRRSDYSRPLPEAAAPAVAMPPAVTPPPLAEEPKTEAKGGEEAKGCSASSAASGQQTSETLQEVGPPPGRADGQTQTDAPQWQVKEEEAGRPATVVLRGLCDMRAVDLVEWPSFFEDMRDDLEKECAHYGEVLRCWVDRSEPRGGAWLSFAAPQQAEACCKAMDQRFYAGSKVTAEIRPGDVWIRNW